MGVRGVRLSVYDVYYVRRCVCADVLETIPPLATNIKLKSETSAKIHTSLRRALDRTGG